MVGLQIELMIQEKVVGPTQQIEGNTTNQAASIWWLKHRSGRHHQAWETSLLILRAEQQRWSFLKDADRTRCRGLVVDAVVNVLVPDKPQLITLPGYGLCFCKH